jgi:hypothetical protein
VPPTVYFSDCLPFVAFRLDSATNFFGHLVLLASGTTERGSPDTVLYCVIGILPLTWSVASTFLTPSGMTVGLRDL